jgi:hypothetical protein
VIDATSPDGEARLREVRSDLRLHVGEAIQEAGELLHGSGVHVVQDDHRPGLTSNVGPGSL